MTQTKQRYMVPPKVKTEKPTYVIYSMGDSGCFKLIKFKHTHESKQMIFEDEEKSESTNEQKLQNNMCRAKSMVLQYGLCNPWSYFATFTLDKKKYNRHDLKKFQKDLSQWIRDERKRLNSDIKFLYVPEQHKDGAWHAHGLLNGIPDTALSDFIRGVHPARIVNSNYKNYPAYEKKFGFISLGKIKNPIASAFYVSKYITKTISNDSMELGTHLYYASKGLNKATKHLDIYYDCPKLDAGLKYHNDFCSVGIVQKRKWHYALENMDDVEFSKLEVLLEDLYVEAVDRFGEIKTVNPFKNEDYENIQIEKGGY